LGETGGDDNADGVALRTRRGISHGDARVYTAVEQASLHGADASSSPRRSTDAAKSTLLNVAAAVEPAAGQWIFDKPLNG